MSDNLELQLRNVKDKKKFTMNSYLVYLLARKNKYKGLSYKGVLG